MRVMLLRWAGFTAVSTVVLALCCALPGAAEIEPPLSVQWVFSMGPDPYNIGAPLITEGRVYVTHAGELHCLDAVTGEELWQFSPEEGLATSSPVASGKIIIVGGSDSCLYGLNAGDGEEVWRQTLAGPVRSDPIIWEGTLVVGANEMVYGIAPETGTVAWACSLTSPVSLGPVTDMALVFFLCQDGSLQCVDASERRFRWATPLRTGPGAFPPVAVGRRVIVASGKTMAAVARSGGVVWTAEMPTGIGGPLTVVEETLYVPTVDGRIWALNGRTGRAQRGAVLQVAGAATAAPLLSGSVVYAATGTALVWALDRETGRDLWAYRCIAPDQGLGEGATFGVYAPLVGSGNSLYALTGSGDLYCFSRSAPDSAGPVFSDLTPEVGEALPGKAAVMVGFTVTDAGSGVDSASIEALVDGRPITVDFDIASGTGAVALTSPADGSHIVKVTAKDYRGNSGLAEWSFLTDATIPVPETEGPTALRQQPAAGRVGAGARAR